MAATASVLPMPMIRVLRRIKILLDRRALCSVSPCEDRPAGDSGALCEC
jgi:hypothetical protein